MTQRRFNNESLREYIDIPQAEPAYYPVDEHHHAKPSIGMKLRAALTRKPWYLTAMAAIIALPLATTIGVGLQTLVRTGGAHEPLRVRSFEDTAARDGILLYGGLRKWDMDEKTLSVRWAPHICGETFGVPEDRDCSGLDSDVSFFLNGDGIPENGSFDFSQAALNYTASRTGYLNYGFEQTLDMDIVQGTRSAQINLGGRESDVLYPFDWYYVEFLVTAVSTGMNTTLPMAAVSLFNVQVNEWMANSEYRYLDSSDGTATRLGVKILLHRHTVVKFSAMLILVFNWLVTFSLLYLTVIHVFARRSLPDQMDGVALPFAGLFALPSVRSVLPGDPPFGCLIDFIGIIPNLAIIAGCATTLLLVRIHRDSECHVRLQSISEKLKGSPQMREP